MQTSCSNNITLEVINSLITNKLDKMSNSNLSANISQFEIYNRICTHEFFSQLVSEQLDLKSFLQAQEPFYWAVKAWGDLMFSVSLVESEHIKSIYYSNYLDEFGNTDSKPHTETFIDYLRVIGFTDNCPNAKPKPIFQFEEYLNEIAHSNTNTRLLAFGTIEFIYIYISLIIHNYVSNKLGKKLEHHYTTHAVLDIDHSLNFLNQVSEFDSQIITKTINIFLNLYLELFELSQS